MPSIEIKESLGCTKKIRVEVERNRLDDEVKTTVRNLKRSVQIPGFRKGKAPESLILKRFEATVRQEALKDMIPKVLKEVFEAEGIKPVGEPGISDLDLRDTGLIAFTVSVEELPEIDLKNFEGLHVTKGILEVTDEIVDNEFEILRHRYAKKTEVDREAQKDDIIIVNLQKLDSAGLPIIGDKIENHIIHLDGKSTPSPEFDKQIFGMKKGDKKVVRFTYDESINNPGLVGETEAYEVDILKVIENEVPDPNDEFAASVGDFKNLDDLRASMIEGLEREFESYAERKLHRDLIEEFIKLSPFEVPNSMVEKIIQSEIDRMSESDTEQIDEETFRPRIRPDAVRAIQTYIIIDKIKELKGIEVSSEEVNDRIESIARINNMKPKELKRKLIREDRFNDIKNDILQDKVYKWMVNVASVNVETIKDKPEDSRIIKP